MSYCCLSCECCCRSEVANLQSALESSKLEESLQDTALFDELKVAQKSCVLARTELANVQTQADKDKDTITWLQSQLHNVELQTVQATDILTSATAVTPVHPNILRSVELQLQSERAHASDLQAEIQRLKTVTANGLMGSERVLQMEVEISELSELLVQARVEATAAQGKLSKQEIATKNQTEHKALNAKLKESAVREKRFEKRAEELEAGIVKQKEGQKLLEKQLAVAKERLRSNERHGACKGLCASLMIELSLVLSSRLLSCPMACLMCVVWQ